MDKPKTVFCDIDGTLLFHHGDTKDNCTLEGGVLSGVPSQLKKWESLNYKVILTTGRKESLREITKAQLLKEGIFFDELIMGLPNGPRVLINDKKPFGVDNMAYVINLVRNEGMKNIDLTSPLVTLKEDDVFHRVEKPWGSEQLLECNDKYVTKKLVMNKGHSCSLQYHKLKTETIVVLSGTLRIYTGMDKDALASAVYVCGETVTIRPYMIHRMEAIEDSVYIECSTNELWDVVRIQDNYNRVS